MGVYITLGASRVLALLLLLLAPIVSFRGHPLYPINTFFSILVRSTQLRHYLRRSLSRFYI
jgi:hypothetical protein